MDQCETQLRPHARELSLALIHDAASALERHFVRCALAGGAPIITPPPEVCEYTARQFEGSPGHDDYSNDAAPNLAWDAMLRLVERLYPDYKD